MKIYSWNVNGVRAGVRKNLLNEILDSNAKIYCIQETKAQDEQVKEALEPLKDFNLYSTSAVKKGYSGVATLSTEKTLSTSVGIYQAEHDTEGRVMVTEFEKFILVNVYVPNSGSKLVRLEYRGIWDAAFADFLKNLKKTKPVVVTGDLNVAHQPIDLARPKPNYNKTAGYTKVEIDGLQHILGLGFVDAYRYFYPDRIQYTFWNVRFGARKRNVGWRIDYFLVDKSLLPHVVDCNIHDQILGSDHCPISLTLQFD